MRRCRVQARLPALGIRLGAVSADTVILGIGDYSGRDEPYCACLVPVQGDAKNGFALYRSGAPGDGVKAPDIGSIVQLDRFDKAVLAPSRKRGLSQGEHDNDDRVVLRSPMLRVNVPRDRWGTSTADPSQYGVMVLMIYLFEAKPRSGLVLREDPFAADIAQAIDAVLSKELPHDDVDLVIVPSTAVRPVVRSTGAGREPADRNCLTFALASCQYTLGMVDGSPAGMSTGPGDDSYDRMRKRVIAGGLVPQFAVLAGDQVYVDATAGLFDPTASRGRFRKPYEQLYGSRVVRDLQRMLRCYMVMDDHEVQDNWEDADDRRLGPLLRQKGRARDAYVEYERGIGTMPQPTPADRLWGQVDIDGYDFFFADTRTERETRTAATLHQALITSKEQHDAIWEWVHRSASDGRPRFLVFSSMPFPRRLATTERASAALLSDAWDGYPASLERLLDAVASAGRSNIVCLSGDEHLSSLATATRTTKVGKIKLRSIHCSGLYTPYPFANSIVEDFAPDGDKLNVKKSAASSAWVVKTKFFSGQGFCLISVAKAAKHWKVRLEFDLRPSGGKVSFAMPL